jgi:hypothetical protein
MNDTGRYRRDAYIVSAPNYEVKKGRLPRTYNASHGITSMIKKLTKWRRRT